MTEADEDLLPIRFFSMLGRVMGLSKTARPRNTQSLRRPLGLDGSRKNGPKASKKTVSDASR